MPLGAWPLIQDAPLPGPSASTDSWQNSSNHQKTFWIKPHHRRGADPGNCLPIVSAMTLRALFMKGTAHHFSALGTKSVSTILFESLRAKLKISDPPPVDEPKTYPQQLIHFVKTRCDRLKGFWIHTLYSNTCFLCTRTLLPGESTVCDQCRGESPTVFHEID